VTEHVSFPLDSLDLSSFLCDSAAPEHAHEYELSALIEHHGASAASGHYTAWVRGSAGGARAGGRGREGAAASAPASAPAQWYHVDDGRVKAVDEAAVAGAQAYLLFYSRREGGSSGGGTGGGGGGGVPALDGGGPVPALDSDSSSSPRDAAADAAPVAVRGSAPGAPPAVAWGEGDEVDSARRPLTARRLRQFRARRRRDPTPTRSARGGHASHASHSTLVAAAAAPASAPASTSEAPAANALPPPRSASHGATHSLTRPGRRLGGSLPPRLRQAFSHRRADASSASAAAAGGGGGGGGAASEATLLLEEELHEAEMTALHAAPFDAPAELRPSSAELFAPLDAGGGMGGGDGCDLSASLPVPLSSDAPLVPARGRSARWRSAGGRRSPLRRMGSARERREARAASREGREAKDGREGSAGREGREAWSLGRRRPWHKHSRIHSWAPDEAARSPTRQRCDQVDLASSAPPGGSWPGGGAGSDLERVRSR